MAFLSSRSSPYKFSALIFSSALSGSKCLFGVYTYLYLAVDIGELVDLVSKLTSLEALYLSKNKIGDQGVQSLSTVALYSLR